MRPIFVITVAQEEVPLISYAANNVKKVYPEAAIVLIADQSRPDVQAVASACGARFVQGYPLKAQPHGGQWWQRFFEEALKERGEVIWKFDPDSRIARPVTHIPDYDCFGTHLGPGEIKEHIQGGCQGFWRTSGERMHQSRCFLDEALTDWHVWAFKEDNDYGGGELKGYLSTDRVMMYCLRKLRMTWGRHTEVMSLWNTEYMPVDLRPWAITHPHKAPG